MKAIKPFVDHVVTSIHTSALTVVDVVFLEVDLKSQSVVDRLTTAAFCMLMLITVCSTWF